MTEPISVRVARLKGCEPAYEEYALHGRSERANGDVTEGEIPIRKWTCRCISGHSYNGRELFFEVHGQSGDEAWLSPAAAFALLSEMVDAGDPFGDGIELGYGPVGLYYAGRSLRDEGETAPTLGEAIAMAWCAMMEAQR